MKRQNLYTTMLVALAIFAGGALNVPAQESGARSTNREADEAAIRANVKYLVDGWNTKSGQLFAKPFAEDADYVVINGTHISGRMTIDKGHQRIFDTIYKDSVLDLSVKQIRFLRPDVALVHVSGLNKMRQAGEMREGKATMTMVLVKEKDVWKIAAFQNTQVAE